VLPTRRSERDKKNARQPEAARSTAAAAAA